MSSWLLEALAVLVALPWWILLARHFVRELRSNRVRPPQAPDRNVRAFERARGRWGHASEDARATPRRLWNAAWGTGRPAHPGSAVGHARPAVARVPAFTRRPRSMGARRG